MLVITIKISKDIVYSNKILIKLIIISLIVLNFNRG